VSISHDAERSKPSISREWDRCPPQVATIYGVDVVDVANEQHSAGFNQAGTGGPSELLAFAAAMLAMFLLLSAPYPRNR
jgi:hypothetical protein